FFARPQFPPGDVTPAGRGLQLVVRHAGRSTGTKRRAACLSYRRGFGNRKRRGRATHGYRGRRRGSVRAGVSVRFCFLESSPLSRLCGRGAGVRVLLFFKSNTPSPPTPLPQSRERGE